MPESLFSPSWYRVKDLTPQLRAHANIVRQRYRGETWHVLQDPANDRYHRFAPAAHYVIGLMDGVRSVEDIWLAAAEELEDDAPTQDEMIRLLGQLHAADVLRSNIPPDATELFDRAERHETQQWKSRLMSPFAIKIHLLDPERFLTATLPLVRPILNWVGAVVWLAVVLPALVLAAVHWTELTEGVLDRLFTPQNLVALWLIFPLLKTLHEFGHGYFARVFGGQVHDMGIMFLVFTPVPYVDASSSWAFPSRYRRALVGAGGMIVEVFIAALAFYVWMAAEPGAIRATAYNALLIGGATTLLFNANPLLRFDGYYILSDLIEIPNLRSRANTYIGGLTTKYIFGNRETELPETAPGEPAWFVLFAVSAFLYRMVIVVAIMMWILDQFFLLGLLLGGVASIGWLGMPLYKGLRFVLTDPSIRRVRRRAVGVTFGGVALLLGGLTLLPVPLRTQVEGVVWLPEESFVRAGGAGFIGNIVAKPGSWVEADQVLIEMVDPVVATDERALVARVAELEARHAAEIVRDRPRADLILEEWEYEKKRLVRMQKRTSKLLIRSRAAGTFVMPRDKDLAGRFVRQGDLLAHVVDLGTVRVRAVIAQDDLHLVRDRVTAAQVRLADSLEDIHTAVLRRIVPAASDRLPSAALGFAGGGEVPVDPSDPDGARAIQSMFEVELELPAHLPLVNAGGRVYVRFEHGREPLALQIYRSVRQLFLSRFQV